MTLRFITWLVLSTALWAAEYPQMGDDIYDPSADAAADIAAALKQADAEGKHVLLDFGANWCVWCRRLHTLFESDATVAAALERAYVIVMIDVNTRNGTDRNAPTIVKYGEPTQHGLPVLMVLDGAGNPQVTQETGALEDGAGHSPAKVLAFLSRWAPAD